MSQHILLIARFSLLALLGTFSAACLAADVFWDGGGPNSEWIEPANWAGNMLPGGGDTAIIINDTATITGDTPFPILALEVGREANPGTLTIAGDAVNSGGLNAVTSITVAKPGSLQVGQAGANLASLNGQSLANGGEVLIGAQGNISLQQNYIQSTGNTTLDGGVLTAQNTLIQGGTVQGVGTVASNVSVGVSSATMLSPGDDVGTFMINGNLILGSRNTLNIEIDASGRDVRADLLNVDGQVSIGGTLNLNVVAGTLAEGDTISVLVADSVQPGTYFDNILGLEQGDDSLVVHFNPGGLTTDPTLDISMSSNKGDMNIDGFINELDARLFAEAIRDRTNYILEYINTSDPPVSCIGSGGGEEMGNQCSVVGPNMADMDFDKANTFADIPLFLAAVNAGGGSPVAALAEILSVLEVPEPASAAMLGIFAIYFGAVFRPTSGRRFRAIR